LRCAEAAAHAVCWHLSGLQGRHAAAVPAGSAGGVQHWGATFTPDTGKLGGWLGLSSPILCASILSARLSIRWWRGAFAGSGDGSREVGAKESLDGLRFKDCGTAGTSVSASDAHPSSDRTEDVLPATAATDESCTGRGAATHWSLWSKAFMRAWRSEWEDGRIWRPKTRRSGPLRDLGVEAGKSDESAHKFFIFVEPGCTMNLFICTSIFSKVSTYRVCSDMITMDPRDSYETDVSETYLKP